MDLPSLCKQTEDEHRDQTNPGLLLSQGHHFSPWAWQNCLQRMSPPALLLKSNCDHCADDSDWPFCKRKTTQKSLEPFTIYILEVFRIQCSGFCQTKLHTYLQSGDMQAEPETSRWSDVSKFHKSAEKSGPCRLLRCGPPAQARNYQSCDKILKVHQMIKANMVKLRHRVIVWH